VEREGTGGKGKEREGKGRNRREREGKQSVNSFPKNFSIGETASGVIRNGFWEEQSAVFAAGRSTKCSMKLQCSWSVARGGRLAEMGTGVKAASA
jgi:hypothetical protein